jgi:hypothetical protein
MARDHWGQSRKHLQRNVSINKKVFDEVRVSLRLLADTQKASILLQPVHTLQTILPFGTMSRDTPQKGDPDVSYPNRYAPMQHPDTWWGYMFQYHVAI